MGTRGYYVFKWRNRYYVFYNHWDSYLEGLGTDIVKELRTLPPEQFQQMRETLEGLKYEPNYGCVKKKGYEGLMKIVENPSEYDLVEIRNRAPESGGDIEYVYIVNLDAESFQVHFKRYISEEIGNFDWEQVDWEFPIHKIPEDWIEQIDKRN